MSLVASTTFCLLSVVLPSFLITCLVEFLQQMKTNICTAHTRSCLVRGSLPVQVTWSLRSENPYANAEHADGTSSRAARCKKGDIDKAVVWLSVCNADCVVAPLPDLSTERCLRSRTLPTMPICEVAPVEGHHRQPKERDLKESFSKDCKHCMNLLGMSLLTPRQIPTKIC